MRIQGRFSRSVYGMLLKLERRIEWNGTALITVAGYAP